jgi:hypothetical protein
VCRTSLHIIMPMMMQLSSPKALATSLTSRDQAKCTSC